MAMAAMMYWLLRFIGYMSLRSIRCRSAATGKPQN
jgi:hypothetical protein